MSINIGDNLSYLGAKPLDGRLKYDTVSAMAGMADNVLYEGCMAYCVGTGKTYQWKSTNTVDPTTGKWREFESGGGGSTGDAVEYVTTLPTTGIENKIYGLKTTSSETQTIEIGGRISSSLTEAQQVEIFSRYFTLTASGTSGVYDITVYPDLVISRQGWTNTYDNILSMQLDTNTMELYWDITGDSVSSVIWANLDIAPIHFTSANFPVYEFYAGNEDTQETYEIGAGGSVDDVIDDVETLPTSDVQNIFYRTTQEQVITSYSDTTTTAIMTAMTPYGFTQGETVTNYETHTGDIYSTLTYLDNARHVYDNFGKPLQMYMFQPQGQSYYKLGCISNGVDAFWNANDPVGFKLGDNGLYTGKSSNNSTSRVAMFDEMSKTFRGTRTQWNALSTAEKKTYDGCALTDDYNAGGEIIVVDEVANGNLNPVTSNAVYNYSPALNAINNPITRDTTHTSDIQEIGAYKQGRIAQIKCYIAFQNIQANTWNTVGTVVDSLKPIMETPLIVSEGAVVVKVALFRLNTDGKIQVWGNNIVDGDTTRVSATYFTAR